jgi:pSer/pThr/pTyr-binding forkhead associated (FHA) protein
MATLVIIEGPDAGQRFLLERHTFVLIGRDDACTFRVSDQLVARNHLQLRLDAEGRHYAIDLKTAGAVRVNGAPIDETVPLNDGDVISIGDSALVYRVADVPEAGNAE